MYKKPRPFLNHSSQKEAKHPSTTPRHTDTTVNLKMARHMITTFLLTVGVYLLLQNTSRQCAGSPAPRPYPRSPHHVPRALDVNFLDEDEAMEKRQFNDYGHMRFGKRSGGDEKFDDYGYMRFGRGVA